MQSERERFQQIYREKALMNGGIHLGGLPIGGGKHCKSHHKKGVGKTKVGYKPKTNSCAKYTKKDYNLTAAEKKERRNKLARKRYRQKREAEGYTVKKRKTGKKCKGGGFDSDEEYGGDFEGEPSDMYYPTSHFSEMTDDYPHDGTMVLGGAKKAAMYRRCKPGKIMPKGSLTAKKVPSKKAFCSEYELIGKARPKKSAHSKTAANCNPWLIFLSSQRTLANLRGEKINLKNKAQVAELKKRYMEGYSHYVLPEECPQKYKTSLANRKLKLPQNIKNEIAATAEQQAISLAETGQIPVGAIDTVANQIAKDLKKEVLTNVSTSTTGQGYGGYY